MGDATPLSPLDPQLPPSPPSPESFFAYMQRRFSDFRRGGPSYYDDDELAPSNPVTPIGEGASASFCIEMSSNGLSR